MRLTGVEVCALLAGSHCVICDIYRAQHRRAFSSYHSIDVQYKKKKKAGVKSRADYFQQHDVYYCLLNTLPPLAGYCAVNQD